MKKTGGRKSRDTLPLTFVPSGLKNISVGLSYGGRMLGSGSIDPDIFRAIFPDFHLPGKGTVSRDLPGKGTLSRDLTGKGTVSRDLTGKGTVSRDLTGKGTVSRDLTGKGTVSRDLTGKGTCHAI